jgi:lantibiotic modifying enzyme
MEILYPTNLRTTWTPLLRGVDTQPLLTCVLEIAAVLKSGLASDSPGTRESIVPYLGHGAAGFGVFLAYAHATGIVPDARQSALEYLQIAINKVAHEPMGPSLYSGFTGIAWAAEHISGLLGEPSGDLNSDVDRAVEAYVSNCPWTNDFDLINGLVGFGVYSLERPRSASAAVALQRIVERFYELAEHSADGVCWFTSPDLFPEEQRAKFPEGYYNLGLAHGVPGIIALLAKTLAMGIAREKASWLLERAIPWLLKQRLPAGSNSCFPTFLVRHQVPADCRLAWCYGDAGLAAALLLAARATAMRPWEDEAVAILKRAAVRPPETSGIKDACFCHGSAGLAHIFNRVFQATRDQLFADAARYWIDRTLHYRQPGKGSAGYSMRTAMPDGRVEQQGTLNILDGIAGIGLTLLAATTGIPPDWDRIFLVDVPPLAAA